MTGYSVIIPTYNRAGLLVEAIDSVLTQDVDGVQIIVVDDGSTDDTRHRLLPYAGRIDYVYQHQTGPAAARNRGLARAGGEYLAFLDSDDLWQPGKIRHDLALFQRYPEADIVTHDADSWVEGKCRFASEFDAHHIAFPDGRPRYFTWTFRNLVRGPLCATSSICMRRRALPVLGPDVYDPQLTLDEDWDLEFRMYSRCRVLFAPNILVRLRAFNDGTRHYSLPGTSRPVMEWRWIWQNQLAILQRYRGSIHWGEEMEHGIRQREEELRQRLASQAVNDCADAGMPVLRTG